MTFAAATPTRTSAVTIEHLDARAYTIPTDRHESDGTLEWDSTTLVVVHVSGGGQRGIGYSYTSAGAIAVIQTELARAIVDRNAMDVGQCWKSLTGAVRNLGPGIASMAVAAVDAALWDLKAKLLDLPLVSLLGRVKEEIPVYGSGGFTSYTDEELQRQLAGWASQGIRMVKMKIGREPERDPQRIRAARKAISPHVELFVDANGAYSRKQALAMAEVLRENDVTWYEQPVWHHDFEGLRMVRDRVPPPIEISSGEYGFEGWYFRTLIDANAVDVLQADPTRCGVTGFLEAAALCEVHFLPLSSHTAPSLSLHVCCASDRARHLEYFHDHVRIEQMLFDGAQRPAGGVLAPDLSRPGIGIELKEKDAERYAAE